VLNRELKESEKEIAGAAVDFGFGILAAGAYGALAEVSSEVTAVDGLAFGGGLWLFADELGVPAAGLSKWPNAYPAWTHAYGLTGHLVYGFATELVRRIVRRALD
jgi:uncharacterized membrane protein YagU involved in acid resistance